MKHCVCVCRFAELMDLTKDRGRLDFFLKKAKTVPAASLDAAADKHSLSAPTMGRADTAPVASSVAACEMPGSARSESTEVAPNEAAEDAAADNEEALYWQQHGEVDEEGGGYEEGYECADAAADLEHRCASWRGAAEHDDLDDDWSEAAGIPSAEQAAAAVKTEPEAPDLAYREQSCKQEASGAAWHPARVKREPLEFHSSAAAHDSKLKVEPVDSLRRFSYTGSPIKQEGREDSQDRRVLVHLGLDSPKPKLPPSMAARGSAALLPRGAGTSSCSSAPVQAQHERGNEPYTMQDANYQYGSLPASVAQEDKLQAEQHTPDCLKQEESCQHVRLAGAAQYADFCRADDTAALKRDRLAHSASPDSWATAPEGSQDKHEQETPQQPLHSPGCMEQDCSKAHASSTAVSVTDICSPEPLQHQQPVFGTSTSVKREHSSTDTACGSIGVRSPGGSERVDLSAIDLAEQQRLLRLIAARKSLQDDIQASRACMQALGAQALPDSSLRKRGRAGAQPYRAPAAVAVTKRRQLGIGAFLFSQQRSDGV